MNTQAALHVPSKRQQIAIVNADSFLGYQIACHLLREDKRGNKRNDKRDDKRGDKHDDKREIDLVCGTAFRDKRDVKERMDALERMGAKIEPMEYHNPESIERVVRHADWVIIIPENESDRVINTKNVIESLRKEQERGSSPGNCLLMSSMGAESDHRHLKDFNEIEKRAEDRLQKLTTFRLAFLQQAFCLWIPCIEETGRFPMPLGHYHKFAPIHLDDVCRAVGEVIHNSHGSEEMPEAHNRQIYTLTGPESLSPERIVQEMNRATYQHVRYQEVTRAEMEKYLRDQLDHGGSHERRYAQALAEEDAAELAGATVSREDCGRHYHPRLTNLMIETLLDFFDYVREGSADLITDHLRKLTGKDGRRLEDFFRESSDWFSIGNGEV